MIVLLYHLYSSVALPADPVHELLSAEDVGTALLDFPYSPLPRRNFASLSKYRPKNIEEPSKFAFALFYCSRNPDLRDPYFETTQAIIWRLLWSDYRSKYPVVVYVCPFIPKENRRIFRGQGAMAKEIELLDNIIPDDVIQTKRWIDVLSKLHLWKEVDWKMLAFLDSDAFPIINIDDIFQMAPEQRCRVEALSPEDREVVENAASGQNMCDYVYAGVPHLTFDNINAGVLVLKPNLDMHAKLIRAATRTGDYHMGDMEQGVLKSKNAFAADGAFPVKLLTKNWNALPEYYIERLEGDKHVEDGEVRILHVKMWNRFWGSWNNLVHLNDKWDIDWMKMSRFYDSEQFVEARKTGNLKAAWDTAPASASTAE